MEGGERREDVRDRSRWRNGEGGGIMRKWLCFEGVGGRGGRVR